MSKLIYITNTSLDGYIEDETGASDWGNADQVLPFVTELLRPVGTYLYGRRLYEAMAYWDAPVESYPPEHRDFAWIWQTGVDPVPWRLSRLRRKDLSLTPFVDRNQRWKIGFLIDFVLRRQTLSAFG